jgi:hypothetical protein
MELAGSKPGTGRAGRSSQITPFLQQKSFHRFPDPFEKSSAAITLCGINVIQLMFGKHFQSFSDQIEENRDCTVMSYVSESDFFKGQTRTFPVMHFFLELTQHISLKGCQSLRRYGLYASRTNGTWLQTPYLRLNLI